MAAESHAPNARALLCNAGAGAAAGTILPLPSLVAWSVPFVDFLGVEGVVLQVLLRLLLYALWMSSRPGFRFMACRSLAASEVSEYVGFTVGVVNYF